MNPQDITAQAQRQMDEVSRLTTEMQQVTARHQSTIDGYTRQVADLQSKIAAEQRTLDQDTSTYRAKIDAASKESQRLSTQASELAQQQAREAERQAH